MADEITVNNFYSGASHFADNTDFEVQRTNHFEVVLDLQPLGLEGDNGNAYSDHIRLSTKSVSAPKMSSEAVSLKHGNDTVKVASAPSFEDVTITIHDTLGRDQVGLLQTWFSRVFNRQTKLMGRVASYKTTGTLYMYAPDCTVIRKWILQGVWPKEFGQSNEFSFDSTETQTISLVLSVDRYFEEIDT